MAGSGAWRWLFFLNLPLAPSQRFSSASSYALAPRRRVSKRNSYRLIGCESRQPSVVYSILICPQPQRKCGYHHEYHPGSGRVDVGRREVPMGLCQSTRPSRCWYRGDHRVLYLRKNLVEGENGKSPVPPQTSVFSSCARYHQLSLQVGLA